MVERAPPQHPHNDPNYRFYLIYPSSLFAKSFEPKTRKYVDQILIIGRKAKAFFIANFIPCKANFRAFVFILRGRGLGEFLFFGLREISALLNLYFVIVLVW